MDMYMSLNMDLVGFWNEFRYRFVYMFGLV